MTDAEQLANDLLNEYHGKPTLQALVAFAEQVNTPLQQRIAALEKQLSEVAGVLDDAETDAVNACCDCVKPTEGGGHQRGCRGVKRSRLYGKAANAARTAVTGTTSDKPPVRSNPKESTE